MVEHTRKTARGKQPISRHPLFPAIVALWGAALFALAALAIKPALPLALAVAIFGGAIGMIVGRRIANPGARDADEKPSADTPEESPLWTELKDHRRALAAGGTESAAPVIDREPQILDLTDVGVEALVSRPARLADTQAVAEPDEAEVAPAQDELAADIEPVEAGGEDAIADPRFEESAAGRIAAADLDNLSHVELLARLALTMQRRGKLADAVESGETPAIATEGTEPTANGEALEPAYGGLLKPVGATESAEAHERDGSEPAVIFPGRSERRHDALPAHRSLDAPQSPEETEKALRAALAALQRMSGAA